MKLKKILYISILALLQALLFSIPTTISIENLGEFHPFSQDQTLYFNRKEIDLWGHGVAFLMDTTLNSGTMKEANKAEFVSLPLANNFTFSNLIITVYHTLISSDGYLVLIKAGWLDIQNQSHVSHLDYENLEVGTEVTLHQFAVDCCGIEVSEGQRFWLELQTSSSDISFSWGNLAHDSGVSYNGTASFVPELPPFLVLPILMLLTLVAVILRVRSFRIW